MGKGKASSTAESRNARAGAARPQAESMTKAGVRTSKKQMQEVEKVLKSEFPNDAVYAVGERDASGKAYIRHNGEWLEYPNNTEAYMAVADLVFG